MQQQFASLCENEDDYFYTLKNYMDPIFLHGVNPHEFYSNVIDFKKSYIELSEKIKEAEKNVERFEKDLKILGDAGEKLVSKDIKTKLKEVCEDFILQNNLAEIKESIEKMYRKRTAYVKALSPVMFQFDNTVCPICFENQVNVFNTQCGHTLCIECSRQTKNCPMCRTLANYKPLIYST